MSVELERLTLRALRDTWDDLNATFFRRQLRRPTLAFTDSTAQLGCWSAAERVLWLSRELLPRHGWGVVVEVLKHEMAHQFVDEVVGFHHEGHGVAFQEVCRQRGIDGRAAGVPLGAPPEAADHRMLERVAKLLALAKSPNEHEAQAAMAAAQRLMLKHNIDSVARRVGVTHSFRHLGKPSGRVAEYERILAAIIGEHFFVEVIWVPVWRPLEGKRGSVLEICGTLENLELAEYVHGFLLQTSERIWREYRRSRRLGSNAERRTFLAGVMAGFRDKLAREKKKHREEGLVWVGDGDLERYFRQRHPRVRMTRYACGQRSDAYSHGREAGGQIVLHRGVQSGPGNGAKLLPSARRT